MILKRYILTIILLSTTVVFAQRPREVQLEDEPFDFTDPIKLIFIVIIPILLLIIGSIYFKKRKKGRKK
ncbi:hypothetical protein DNU06_06850 [Putridiphycobacter roseus]|uniref:Uncharacterized protein n=1 Tax=Putridiphycobacter roseus TaxID=2219161 RepID=A0A2W1N1V1_9FLAO|nr:hypothetical protein [Putridiphycobacter roseus]PZE17540.1 hypothetical protein DNU06_06850 [Putridiphycobacter roseus]